MDIGNKKRQGMDFWKTTLKSARLVVAPMVDQSELAWRLLSRRHGAELCYSPMFHASVFIRDHGYRKEALASCPEDRPLIIQFCANKPETLLKAAKYAAPHCDAVDLNLGCPQAIAKRGHYGVFLQDEWDLLHDMVSLCAAELSVPITCKMRVFDDLDKTVRYAQMLEKAGCQLLAVHGRTKDQKGANTGLANWAYIKAIKDAVKIPVFANGNIQYMSDVERCLEETGVEGVMTAEGNLHNPALFEGTQPPVLDLAEEYLEIVKEHPCPMSYVRGHLFKLLHHALLIHTELREILGGCRFVTEAQDVVKRLRGMCQPDIEKYVADHENDVNADTRSPPYWICQPYVRPTPEETEARQQARQTKRSHSIEDKDSPTNQGLSQRQRKRLKRYLKKAFNREEKFVKCSQCGNPKGQRCVFAMCRACCRKKAYEDIEDCPGHRILAKTKQNKLRASENGERENTALERRDRGKPCSVENAKCDAVENAKCDKILNISTSDATENCDGPSEAGSEHGEETSAAETTPQETTVG